MRVGEIGWGAWIVAAALAAAAPATAAQPNAAGSAAELNPAGRVAAPPPVDNDLFSPDPPGPCPLNGSDLQVTLTSVGFRGVTALQPGELAPAYAGSIGKPIPVSAICAIRDRAARILFDRGILARVEIPAQRIAGGALVLEVIEARIVNVRVRGDAGPAQAQVERYVEQLRGMKPFDMRKAQRYLLLASDIPGVTVRASVRPAASGEPGAVDIDVTARRDPFNALVNVQNLGSRPIGRWGGLVRADLNGFTPLGERTSLIGFHTLDSNEQWVLQLLEEARIGGGGLVARASLAYGQTRPGDVLKPLGLKSDAVVGEAEAAYPLVRRRSHSLYLAAGMDWVDQSTDVTGAVRLSRDKLRVLYVRANSDWHVRAMGLPTSVSGSVSLRQGIEGLGASNAGSALLSRAGGRPDSLVLRGFLDVQSSVSRAVQVSARFAGQYSERPLLAYEQFALGNLTAPRGYDPAVISGDSGASASLELRYSAIPVASRLIVSPYAFYDLGWIDNNRASLAAGTLPSRTLQSAGAGLTFRLSDRANLDVVYAAPLTSVLPGIGKPHGRALVSLTSSLN